MTEETVSRRGFLKAAAVTAVAATATGAGAALLNSPSQAPAVAPLSAPIGNAPLPPVVSAHSDAAEIMAQLMRAQAENIRLQAELDAAQRRLEGVRGMAGNDQVAVERLSEELNSAHGQIGILSGLVALYEQLEDIDLGALVDSGLAALDTAVTDLAEELPSLNEGLESGRQALAEFEAQVPLVAAGRAWLESQFDALEAFYGIVVQRLANVVDGAGDFLQLLGQWFQDVLRWLPFGMGNGAATVVEALTNLLAKTAETVGLRRVKASQPLDLWFAATHEGEIPLREKLIRPLREATFAPAGEVANRAQTMRTAYQNQLSGPARSALTGQKLLKQQIVAYRAQHSVERRV